MIDFSKLNLIPLHFNISIIRLRTVRLSFHLLYVLSLSPLVLSSHQALEMIAGVRSSFDGLLETVEWMDDETRAVAKQKVWSDKHLLGMGKWLPLARAAKWLMPHDSRDRILGEHDFSSTQDMHIQLIHKLEHKTSTIWTANFNIDDILLSRISQSVTDSMRNSYLLVLTLNVVFDILLLFIYIYMCYYIILYKVFWYLQSAAISEKIGYPDWINNDTRLNEEYKGVRYYTLN